MEPTNSPKDMTDEALVAELKRRVPHLSDSLREELSVSLAKDSRSRIGDTLSSFGQDDDLLDPNWMSR